MHVVVLLNNSRTGRRAIRYPGDTVAVQGINADHYEGIQGIIDDWPENM
jgi:hypothetical protein